MLLKEFRTSGATYLFALLLPDFTEERKIISKIQFDAMIEGAPRFMLVTEETTGGTLRVTEPSKRKIRRCRQISGKIQKLLFPCVDTKYHDNIKKILALFAGMWSKMLGCIDAVKHRTNLTEDSVPFRFAIYWAEPSAHKLEERKVLRQLIADVIELAASNELRPSYAFQKKKDHSNSVLISDVQLILRLMIRIDQLVLTIVSSR